MPETLWDDRPATRRSEELTCLYVQRYSGPRLHTHLTNHPFSELLYVFHGRGVLRGEKPVPLREGTAVLIPPGVAHLEHAPKQLDTLWIGLQGWRVETNELRCVTNVEIGPILESIWLLGQRRYGLCGSELDGLCIQAIGRFDRLCDEAGATEAELVHRATAYLRRHSARPITVAILAAELHVSEGHLHRRFRAATGKTPIAYLTDLRLAAAMEMIRHSDLPLSRVARLSGFTDPLYFSRVCRRQTGYPPSHWREQRGTGNSPPGTA